jgi:hypothetical protein
MITFDSRKSTKMIKIEATTTDWVVERPTPTVPPLVLKPL